MMRRCKKLHKLEQMGESSSQWSHLPHQILSKIASFLELEGPSDKCRFQLVCKKWYDSCSSSSKHVLYHNFPIKIPIISPIFVQDKGPIFIVGTCVFLVQPSDQPLTQPWLVFVEELNLGKLRMHAPLTKQQIVDMPLNFPKGLDFSGFRVSLVHKGLKMCFGNGSEDVVRVHEKENCWFGLAGRSKVIFVSNEENLRHSGCVAIVFAVCGGGALMSFNVSTGGWTVLTSARLCLFDDIVCFKGLVYGIDRKGRLYLIDVDNLAKLGNAIANGICEGLDTDTRKHLFVLDGELHMIHLSHRKFEVYKLNAGLLKWETTKSVGNRIVLATPDDVFWVSAREFPRSRGNCIVFSKQCFPVYMGSCSFENILFRGAEKYLEVGVYYLGEDCYLPISSYPELCEMLRPFPSWICSNPPSVASSSREVEERQSNPPRLTALISSRDALDMPTVSSAQTFREFVAKKEIRHPNNEDSAQAICYIPQIHESGSSTKALHITCGKVRKKPFPDIIDVDSEDDSSNTITVEKFEGVNISSCFVPILHKIRNKYGNIIQGNVDEVQSNSLYLKCCLETLAQTVTILESNSPVSLSDTDVKFLGASVYDLQSMRFNVEVVNWLVPLVSSVLDHHHKNKDHVCKLKEVQSVRLKMLDVLRQLEEEEKKIAENLSDSPLLFIKNSLDEIPSIRK